MNARIMILAMLLCSTTAWSSEFSPGEATYMAYCAACHGGEGDGKGRSGRGLTPPPRDFTALVSQSVLSEKRMIRSISQGRPGTAMVPWEGRLSRKEIAEVVAFIQQEFMRMDKHWLTGKSIYIKHCSPCHGDSGSSARWTKTSLNPPPRDFTTATSLRELSRARMVDSVTYGRSGTAMMPFQRRLNTDEVGAVVDYIRTSFMQKGITKGRSSGSVTPKPASRAPSHKEFDVSRLSSISGADMTLAFPKKLMGNASNGRHFFMNNCFSCHGKNGDGRGPRAKFIFPKPRNFHSKESKTYLNRPALFSAITYGKPGTVMPAWGHVLSQQQVADVAEFIFRAFIQDEGTDLSTEEMALDWKKKQQP